MTQVIIYTNEEGYVAVCMPTGELPIQEVKEKDTPADSIIVNKEDLPYEYDDFHSAWVLNNGVVTVDKNKAVEHTKARLRYEREPLFAKQDVLFQIALETGADTTAIVAEKNRLRNLPNLATPDLTLEQLRNLSAV
jgi:hypothetical protein